MDSIESVPNAGIMGANGKLYPICNISQQGGLKRDIIELVLNLAAPDDDCMLSDFLHALQYVLDKHSANWQKQQSNQEVVELIARMKVEPKSGADRVFNTIIDQVLTQIKK